MLFLRRLFESDAVHELRLKLQETEVERDRYKRLYEETAQELTTTVKTLNSERHRNRRREDAFIDQIVELGGGRRLPTRTAPEPVENETPPALSQQDETELRARANQYAEQKAAREGLRPVAEADYVEAYEMMLKDKEYWLSDH